MMGDLKTGLVVLIVLGVLAYGMYRPDKWHSFLDSLDTEGGYMVCLFILLLIGWRMFQFDATAGGSIMTLASGSILSRREKKKKLSEQNGNGIDPNVDSTGGTK